MQKLACCKQSMTEDNDDKYFQPQLSKRRWAYLGIIVLTLQIVRNYSVMSSGQISNVYVVFFNATYEQVDWFTEIPFLVQSLASPFLAWFSHSQPRFLRLVCLVAAGCVATGYFFSTVALTNGKLLSVMLIGQIFQGLALTVADTIPSTFAIKWFPPAQVGTAIGLNIIGISGGTFIAGSIPPRVLQNPSKCSTQNDTLSSAQNCSKSVVETDIFILLKISGIFFAFSVASLVFLALFLTEGPPTPPSQAETLRSSASNNKEQANFGEFWSNSKRLLCDTSYMFISLSCGLQYHVFVVETIMMSQIVRSVANVSEKQINDYVAGGNVLMLFSGASACGALVMGRVIDSVHNHLAIARVAAFLSMLSSAGIVLGFHYLSMTGLYISIFAHGFFSRVVMVSAYEVIAQHTYPMNELFTACWLGGLQGWLTVVVGQVARVTFKFAGGEKTLIFVQTGGLIVSFFGICLIRPNYKRREANKELSKDEEDENSLLIENSEGKESHALLPARR